MRKALQALVLGTFAFLGLAASGQQAHADIVVYDKASAKYIRKPHPLVVEHYFYVASPVSFVAEQEIANLTPFYTTEPANTWVQFQTIIGELYYQATEEYSIYATTTTTGTVPSFTVYCYY